MELNDDRIRCPGEPVANATDVMVRGFLDTLASLLSGPPYTVKNRAVASQPCVQKENLCTVSKQAQVLIVRPGCFDER